MSMSKEGENKLTWQHGDSSDPYGVAPDAPAGPQDTDSELALLRERCADLSEANQRLTIELAAAQRRIAKLHQDERRVGWLFLHCSITTRALSDDAELLTVHTKQRVDAALEEEDKAMLGVA